MSKNLTKLSRSSVFGMIKISVKESRVFKDVSPHSFRATLATLLHNQGVPIVQIQGLLNHKLISTTSIYLKKSSELTESATQKIGFLE
jgi:site-specific recombinase XerD